MDKAAIIATEALVYIARAFPPEHKLGQKFKEDVKEMIDQLQAVYEMVQKEKHDSHAKMTGRIISPCPCGDCVPDQLDEEEETLRTAVISDIEASATKIEQVPINKVVYLGASSGAGTA